MKSNYIKYLFLILFLSAGSIYSQPLNTDRARGLFFSVGIGPRIPVSEFASEQSMGFGMTMEISYTDNEYLPLFLYTKIGYEQFPGSMDFYRKSDYSSLTTHVIPVYAGAKLFFPPIVEDLVLLMPEVELGVSYALYEKSHQFKTGTGRNNYLESTSRFGFHIGAGVSMFLLELTGAYNYFPKNESLSANLSVRIPIFIQL